MPNRHSFRRPVFGPPRSAVGSRPRAGQKSWPDRPLRKTAAGPQAAVGLHFGRGAKATALVPESCSAWRRRSAGSIFPAFSRITMPTAGQRANRRNSLRTSAAAGTRATINTPPRLACSHSRVGRPYRPAAAIAGALHRARAADRELLLRADRVASRRKCSRAAPNAFDRVPKNRWTEPATGGCQTAPVATSERPAAESGIRSDRRKERRASKNRARQSRLPAGLSGHAALGGAQRIAGLQGRGIRRLGSMEPRLGMTPTISRRQVQPVPPALRRGQPSFRSPR